VGDVGGDGAPAGSGVDGLGGEESEERRAQPTVASLVLKFATASNAPKRSDRICSSRVGDRHVLFHPLPHRVAKGGVLRSSSPFNRDTLSPHVYADAYPFSG
jgi:hypothetical protein